MKILQTFFFLFIGLSSFAQNIVVSAPLTFSNTNELQKDSSFVWVKNNYDNTSLTITNVELPSFYKYQAITQKSIGSGNIAAKDSLQLWFYFQPEQNIFHEKDILITFNNGESVIIEVEGQGEFSNTYYQTTQNREEESLKSALSLRISSPFVSLSYNNARDNMYATIDNVGGDVECVYTGRTATFNTRAGANSNNFNCEHTFPQSMFNSNQPMQGDIHHLFPTDASANSVRSNNPFGVVGSNPTWSEGGSKYRSSVFEPRDAHKGDCARAMMYMVIRYQDFQNFFAPQESTLRQWHDDFPPTQKSIDRNNAINALQKNRNPFVDYPQLIKRISKLSGNSVPNPQPSFTFSTDAVVFNKVNPSTGKAIIIKGVSNTGNTTIKLFEPSFSLGNHAILNFDTTDTITLIPGASVQLLFEMSPTSQAETVVDVSINTNLTTGPLLFEVSWDPVLSLSNSLFNSTKKELNFYPNPTENLFFIDGNELISSVEVFDLTGRKLSIDFDNTSKSVALPMGTSKGLYFVKIDTDSGLKTSLITVK